MENRVGVHMTIDDASRLLREAAARFAEANVVWRRARIGLFGFWVGDDPLKEMETPLQRARLSENAWRNCTVTEKILIRVLLNSCLLAV